MRKKRLHAIILFVLFMMLCACAAAEGRVVRMAFLEQEGMSFIGHTGKITGYNFDYLEKISEYTGWRTIPLEPISGIYCSCVII